MQPLPTLATQTYLVTNQPSVSVGCADIYGDGKGSQLGVAVLIHSASGASGYVPTLLQLLLRRAPGSLRTTISDMYVALFNDDTSNGGHAPGTVVSPQQLRASTVHSASPACIMSSVPAPL